MEVLEIYGYFIPIPFYISDICIHLFGRLHSTAEALHQHNLLRRKYRIEYGLLDPLAGQKDKSRLDTSIPDDPKYPQFTVGVPERLWDPSTLRRKVLFNNNRPITWRGKIFV